VTLHVRVWRRVRIMPGVWMNVTKRGVSSFTFGKSGMRYTIGRKHTRATVGLTGSGIFVSDIRKRSGTGPQPSRFGLWLIVIGLLGLLLLLGAVGCAQAAEHRSHAVLDAFQRAHPCPSTGLPHGACPGWVKDHICPLACGGPDAVSNLQWQTEADAKAKDRWELLCWTCK
jgi:hypothetical protein